MTKYWGRIIYHDTWWNMGEATAYYFTHRDLVILPTQEGDLVIKSDGCGIADETTVKLTPTPGDSGCGTPNFVERHQGEHSGGDDAGPISACETACRAHAEKPSVRYLDSEEFH